MIRWLLPLMLAACSAAPVAVPVAPVPLRNPTAPVASQADVTLARIEGPWRVVQSSRAYPGTPVMIGGDAMQLGTTAKPLIALGKGRYAWGEGKLWVHWLDADNRTVALGDPGGTWFAILDRTGKPGERLHAAREILEWYGYDLSRVATLGDKT
ncbi:lipocalin [Sagittula sp. S175]|uniref:lipocalin n=1 Tax=Sagittula sp. S175 TaxID=3415129 RepID=UPI003C7D07EB